MIRRPLLFTALLLLLLSRSTSAAAPNVVMIISDDQMWTDFGFMGHPEIKTPHLDRLAKRSALFPRGYVPSSLCRPSLATMISGLYPHQHKISGNDPPKGVDRRKMEKHIKAIPALPRLLAEKGYVSHQSGKWWEGAPALAGFTEGMTHGDTTRGGRHGDVGLQIGRKGMKPVFDFIDKSQAAGKPFFVWYAPFLPHTPHNPPERLLKKYRKPGKSIHVARYHAMCEWFDETCGQLLNHLDKKKLTEDTLVVFVTDNGWIQSKDSRRYAPKSKRSPYDGGIRTPIMLRWPGHVAPGKYDTLVNSIDLAPTILAAAGLEKSRGMQGINLIDVVKNKGKSDRDTIFGEIYAHDVADIDNPSKSLLYRWAVSDDAWKLIVPTGDEPVELYDLTKDPHETKNLAEKNPRVVAKLRKRIDENSYHHTSMWHVVGSNCQVAKSGKGELSVTVRVRPGWRIYTTSQSPKGGIPTEIRVATSKNFRVVGPFATEAKIHHVRYEELPGFEYEYHEGTVTWKTPIQISAGVDHSKLVIQGSIRAVAESSSEARIYRQRFGTVCTSE